MKLPKRRIINIESPLFWFYVGLQALVLFFLMRPAVDVNYPAHIHERPSEIKERFSAWLQDRGYASDSLAILVYRLQAYASKDREALLGWRVVASINQAKPLYVIPENNSVFEDYGIASWSFDDWGRPLAVKTSTSPYALVKDEIHVDNLADSISSWFSVLNWSGEFTLQLSNDGQDSLLLSDQPYGKMRIQHAERRLHSDSLITFGAALIPGSQGIQLDDFMSDSGNILVLFSILLTVVILIVGYIRRSTEGAVDWKRGSLMAGLFALLYIVYRGLLYYPGFSAFPNQMFYYAIFAEMLNMIMFGLFFGLAFVTWESLGRKNNSSQMRLIDAIFTGRWFSKDLGEGFLRGFGVGSVMLLTLAVSLYGLGQFDGGEPLKYGQGSMAVQFADITGVLPGVAQLISMIMTVMAFGVLVVGLADELITDIVSNRKLDQVLTVLVASVNAVIVSRFFSTSATYFQDWLLMVVFSLVLLIFWWRFGVITALSGLAFCVSVITVLPLATADHSYYLFQAVIVLGFWATAYILAIFLYKMGPELGDKEFYIPEYEERKRQQIRINNELQMAAESQFMLMPQSTPKFEAAEISGFFIPSFEVGGDFYDFLMRDGEAGEELCFVVADVSGKSMRAAMHAVYCSGLIMSRMVSNYPARLLGAISPIVKRKTDPKTFISALVGVFNADSNTLIYANAGHCPPILKREGEVLELKNSVSHLPLGVREAGHYVQYEKELKSGDIVVAYSDGLTEAVGENHSRLGEEKFFRLIREMPTEDMSAEQISREIKKFIQDFSNYQMADDTTVICLKVK